MEAAKAKNWTAELRGKKSGSVLLQQVVALLKEYIY
jgi:hypothetical protein